mmetsp:Transcript_66753/g.195176  ORF Transcript_66753/g.195176 Transcript_66753/m.195176 type:complete len:257 (+) Transcript_66753:69-839(+)
MMAASSMQTCTTTRSLTWLSSIAPSFVLDLRLLRSCLCEELRHLLACLLRDLRQGRGALRVISLVPEGDRDSTGSSTSRSADPVHVTLDIPGHVEVDHMGDRANVESAGTHVRGKHEPAIAIGKPSQVAVTLPLRLVAVKSRRFEAFGAEALGKAVNATLGVGKADQLRCLREAVEDPPELVLFLVVVQLVELLGHSSVGRQLLCLTHVHMHVVLLEVVGCNLLDSLGPRGGEEQRLPLCRSQCQDLRDLGLEAHV